MSRGRRIAAVGLAVALGLTAAPVSAAPLEGRYRLVEQFYGGSLTNLADDEKPLRLEFTRSGAVAEATVRAGSPTSPGHPWPAFWTDSGDLAVRMIERSEDVEAGGIRARYRVEPSSDLTLEIVEDYRSAANGRDLVGTYTVSFLARDHSGTLTPRGSYVLHRRFEREP